MYNTQLLWETGEVSWEPYTRKTRPACTTPTQLPLPSTLKSTAYSTLLAGNSGTQETSQDPETTYPLAKQPAKLHSFRTKAVYMYGFQVPRDYEQAVSIDEATRTPSGKTRQRKNSVRLMNMRPSMTKGKDINLALNTRDVYISSTLSNMTVATRHVSWQEDISLNNHRLCVLISRISQRHPYSYISIGTQRLRNMELTYVCVLGKLHTGESVHRRWPRVRTTRETRTDNIQGSLRTEIIRTQMVTTICRRTTTDGILSKAEKDIWMRDKVITTNT
jgi:hypothetical protein